MKNDLTKIAGLLLLCAAIGFTTGHTLAVSLAGAIAIIVWQLWRFRTLHHWLSHKSIRLPESDGLLYLLHRDIDRMRKRNKSQKRQLASTLKQFRQAAAILPDAVAILNVYGEIQWANKLAQELLGIKWPEDQNLRITNLIRNPSFTHEMAKLTATSNPEPLNIDIDNPINNTRKINVKVIDFEADSQMLVARDITRLTSINQTQKDFVGNVSHELKTPLTVLRGYVETLQDKPELRKGIEQPLDNMEIQVRRMQMIVDDLLYLSKLEQGNKPNFSKTVNVAQLLHDIHQAASPFAEKRQHIIKFEVDTELALHGNERELFSAFNNLVMNAINYTPIKGVIEIKWQVRQSSAVFSVIDNGQGIANKHLERLTERFYRVDSGRARHKGGTGLGLAIVNNILQRHNAELKINSSLGQGSCFECIFPIELVAKSTRYAAS